MLLGCIGDDFTGSSDLANTRAKAGMRTVQYNGAPETDSDPSVGTGVVALKTRTIPVEEAVEQSLAALKWLRRQGCRQYLFKYCSNSIRRPKAISGPCSTRSATRWERLAQSSALRFRRPAARSIRAISSSTTVFSVNQAWRSIR